MSAERTKNGYGRQPFHSGFSASPDSSGTPAVTSFHRAWLSPMGWHAGALEAWVRQEHPELQGELRSVLGDQKVPREKPWAEQVLVSVMGDTFGKEEGAKEAASPAKEPAAASPAPKAEPEKLEDAALAWPSSEKVAGKPVPLGKW